MATQPYGQWPGFASRLKHPEKGDPRVSLLTFTASNGAVGTSNDVVGPRPLLDWFWATHVGADKTSNSGYVWSNDYATGAGYATVRSGTTGTTLAAQGFTTYVQVGQNAVPDIDFGTVYDYSQGFVEFDTSTFTGTVTAATLTITTLGAAPATLPIIEAYAYDFGTSITTADFIAPASLPSVTNRLAALPLPTWSGSTAQTLLMQSSDALATAVNVGGKTRFLFITDRMRTGTTPTGSETIQAASITLTLSVIGYAPVLPVSGTIGQTENRDAIVASGTLTIAGSVNVTERHDTATATSTLTDSGIANTTGQQDNLTAAGTVTATTVSGAVAAIDTRDIGAASGVITFVVAGTINVTDTHDTASGTATLTISVTVAVTDRRDIGTTTAAVTDNGTISGTNQNDQAAGVGVVTVTGTVANVERHDLASSNVVIVATGTPVDRNDLATAVGTVIVVITGTPVDQHDTSVGGYIVATYGPLARWGEPSSVIYLELSKISGKEPAGVATVEPTVVVYRQPQGVQ